MDVDGNAQYTTLKKEFNILKNTLRRSVESYHTRLKTRSCRFNIILILFYNNTTAYSG